MKAIFIVILLSAHAGILLCQPDDYDYFYPPPPVEDDHVDDDDHDDWSYATIADSSVYGYDTTDIGTGLFYYQPDKHVLEYNIWFLVSGNQTYTTAHLHGPASYGQNASSIHDLNCTYVLQAGYGPLHCKTSWEVPEEYWDVVRDGRYYYSVKTQQYPNGYLSGYATRSQEFVTVLGGLLKEVVSNQGGASDNVDDDNGGEIDDDIGDDDDDHDDNAESKAVTGGGESVVILDRQNNTLRYAVLNKFSDKEVSDLYISPDDEDDEGDNSAEHYDLKQTGVVQNYTAYASAVVLDADKPLAAKEDDDTYVVVRLANNTVYRAELHHVEGPSDDE